MAKIFISWIKAARLRTLPLSVSGILVGSFAAYADGLFNMSIFLLSLSTTISYQILSNFANDFGDGIKGADKNRIGPTRLIQSGQISKTQMILGIKISVFISFILTVILIFTSFKGSLFNIAVFLFLGILAIISAIKYTIGKNAYGYIGLGDVFVFIFFGLVSVMGSNFLYSSEIKLELIFPSLTLGFLSAAVLNLNNMRDLRNDKQSKKNTIAVKLGAQNAKIYHYILILLSIINVLLFYFNTEQNSLFNIIMVFSVIIILLYHIFQVSILSREIDFDKLLKPLVLTTFFYSLIISSNYILL
ncbi:MAG: 1,4-dihydroxy-2-naphthoate octaprenyltransferase [Flavobacteriaceae bacterium]|nr:1,4-dihydroxy-2-naphthoate octaprenyltransferase [Flavobacteriaceae bacterium]